jgi:hypothetical protein
VQYLFSKNSVDLTFIEELNDNAVTKYQINDKISKYSELFKLDGNGIGRHVLAMVICGLVYMGALVIIETWWFVIRAKLMALGQILCRGKENNLISDAEDKNVTGERNRVRVI